MSAASTLLLDMTPRQCADELAMLAGFVRSMPWTLSFIRDLAFYLGLDEHDDR